MFRLLALVAAASAYPQHFYNPYMLAPYPLAYAPVSPAAQVFPAPAPAPVVQARSTDEFELIQDAKEARYLINFEAFQRVSGTFVAVPQTAAIANRPLTVTGTISFYQNPLTGQNARYKISLTGLTAGQVVFVGLVVTPDQCVTINAAPAQVVSIVGCLIINSFTKSFSSLGSPGNSHCPHVQSTGSARQCLRQN